MNKHIIGIAVFITIVVVFVSANLLINPSLDEVISVAEPFTKPNLAHSRKISHRVESVQYDLDSEKLSSRLDVNWRGEGPDTLYVKIQLFSDGKVVASDTDALNVSKHDRYSGVVWFPELRVDELDGIDRASTIYASFEVSDSPFDSVKNEAAEQEFVQVLLVHGSRSVLK